MDRGSPRLAAVEQRRCDALDDRTLNPIDRASLRMSSSPLLAKRRRLPSGDWEVSGDGRRRGAAGRATGAECPPQAMLWSGNFAAVFRIHCPATGNDWALKCFTREVPGLQERYRQIAAHLDQARLPFTVDFQYLENGVCVRKYWFPALKMRWVEGLQTQPVRGRAHRAAAEPENALGALGEARCAAPRGEYRACRPAARQRAARAPGPRGPGLALDRLRRHVRPQSRRDALRPSWDIRPTSTRNGSGRNPTTANWTASPTW